MLSARAGARGDVLDAYSAWLLPSRRRLGFQRGVPWLPVRWVSLITGDRSARAHGRRRAVHVFLRILSRV